MSHRKQKRPIKEIKRERERVQEREVKRERRTLIFDC